MYTDNPNDCIEFKFAGILTEYERLIWSKLFLYAKSFKVKESDLTAYCEEFGLAMPINKSVEEVLAGMESHAYIKLQDESGRVLRGLNSCVQEITPTFLLNRFNKRLNNEFGKLQAYLDKGDFSTEARSICQSLSESMIGYNVWISAYLFHSPFFSHYELTLQGFQKLYPISDFFRYGQSCLDLVRAVVYGHQMGIRRQEEGLELFMALFTTMTQLKGYCAFCCLIGMLFDELNSTKHYKAFIDIVFYILYHYQNACIYKIEFAVSPQNTLKAVEERGSDDHTTRMKLFLFDSKGEPTLIRLDMPHKGINSIHFNIRTLYDKCKDDHLAISSDPEELESVFDTLQEQMAKECCHLFVWKDSTSTDDDQVLEEMKCFKLIDALSMDYLSHHEASDALPPFCEAMEQHFDKLSDAIMEGYLSLQ